MTKDEAYIAQRTNASHCKIIPDHDKTPKGQYVATVFGTDPETRQHYAFHCKYPLASNWQEKLIKAILSKKREKA
jgi:hypothetical protein